MKVRARIAVRLIIPLNKTQQETQLNKRHATGGVMGDHGYKGCVYAALRTNKQMTCLDLR